MFLIGQISPISDSQVSVLGPFSRASKITTVETIQYCIVVGLVFVILWAIIFLLVLCMKVPNEDGLLLLRLFLVLNATLCCNFLLFSAVISYEVGSRARTLSGVVIKTGDFGPRAWET
jgi:hypothetical protein